MLRRPTAEALEKLASALKINQKDKAQEGPWIFNASQRKVARLLTEVTLLCVVKSRQWGCTTLALLWLAVLAIMNPRQRFALILYKKDIACEKLGELKGLLRQIGVRLETDNAAKVVLSNGAEIHALGSSGGEAEDAESNVARGLTFAAAVMSDAGYFRNPRVWNAVKAAVGNGPVLVEGTAQGPVGLLWEKWESEDFTQFFSGVEDDARCRAPAETIDDATWQQLREEYGFASRETAAWWHKELDGGNVTSHLRDYPILPEHPWRVSEGRWVQVNPPVVEPSAREGLIEIWSPPVPLHEANPLRHRCLLTVDVSYGLGADYTSALVLDRHDGRVLAAAISNEHDPEAFAPHVARLKELYRPEIVIVEANGACGQKLIAALTKLGILVEEVTQTEVSKYDGLLQAKKAVERGIAYGPERLAQECRELRHKQKDDKTLFFGPKDTLVSLGHGLRYIKANPWTPLAPGTTDEHLLYRRAVDDAMSPPGDPLYG